MSINTNLTERKFPTINLYNQTYHDVAHFPRVKGSWWSFFVTINEWKVLLTVRFNDLIADYKKVSHFLFVPKETIEYSMNSSQSTGRSQDSNVSISYLLYLVRYLAGTGESFQRRPPWHGENLPVIRATNSVNPLRMELKNLTMTRNVLYI